MSLACAAEDQRAPIVDRPIQVLCFGEVLWDCKKDGRYPGGAPCNVAYHLHRIGCVARLVSAVGCDADGDEMLAYLRSRGLATDLVSRHPTLPTGTVQVIGPANNPRYDIRTGVAWDEIALNDAIRQVARETDAIVFGTLAARSETNRRTLDALLAVPGPLKMIDVNLRPPFDDHERALGLARRADWIKLNEAELRQLTGLPTDDGHWPEALDCLRKMTNNDRICVTRGGQGAVLFQPGATIAGQPPPVSVVDTVGAGDAFTAALLQGLLAWPVERAPEVLARALRLGALVASLPGAQPGYNVPWTD
jgi:fructokinase